MKSLILVFLFFGMAMFYIGCSDNNPSAPQLNQNDQTATSIAKVVTTFEGTSNFIKLLDPGSTTDLPGGKTLTSGQVARWHDYADDPRVTGFGDWVLNIKLNKDGQGQVWGTAEMLVDNDGGKWEITWHGVIWLVHPVTGDLYIKVIASGKGTDGDVEGLAAEWTYILDNLNNGYMYKSKGFIREK